MGLPFPECTDDKAAEKEKMKQMLKDAQAAAGLIPASAQADVAPYLKKMQGYIDTVIDGLPPCKVIHTKGFDELSKVITSDDDITKIVDWLNGLKLPDCSDNKEKTKKEIEQMLADVKDAIGWIQQASKVGKFKEKADAAVIASQKIQKKIEDFLKTIDQLKPCKDEGIRKSSKFIFRSFGYYSKSGGNTYNVTFTGDSTQQCTFADGTGVPAPIEFADANGNPTETYFDPKTGESSDFGSDETPPPGWIKVIPTTDPKPKPGMWNLGHQPELWVDPNTGQTKWVEVGSDYKPVDPPQGWVELVPRKQPPETPSERPVATTETPPRTPTSETPKTPTTETPRTPDAPPRTPTTDAPPPRTPETPPTQTTDVPPKTPTSDDIPSTVFVKANEEVVRGEPTGQPLASQMVKLLAERPALPSSRESKMAQDTGFDKPPAQCTTGADGRCKFEVPADERPV
jgi:hypothetical protein